VHDRQRLLHARCAPHGWAWRNADDSDSDALADAERDDAAPLTSSPRCCYSVAFACDGGAAYASDAEAVLAAGGAELQVSLSQLLEQNHSGSAEEHAAPLPATVTPDEVAAGPLGGTAALVTLRLPPPGADADDADADASSAFALPLVVASSADVAGGGVEGYEARLARVWRACAHLDCEAPRAADEDGTRGCVAAA
jgi:hypothetical protein